MKSNYILSGIFALLFIIFLSFQFQGEDIPKNKNEYEYSKTSEMPNMKIEKGKPYSFDAETGCIRGFLTKETYAEVEGCYSEITLISDKDTILGGVKCDSEGIFFEKMKLNIYEGVDKAKKDADCDKFYYVSDELEIKGKTGKIWDIPKQGDNFVIETYADGKIKNRDSVSEGDSWTIWLCEDTTVNILPNNEPIVFNKGNGFEKNIVKLYMANDDPYHTKETHDQYKIKIPVLEKGEVYETDIWLDEKDSVDAVDGFCNENLVKIKTTGKWKKVNGYFDPEFKNSGYLKIKPLDCMAISNISIYRNVNVVNLKPGEKYCVSTTSGDELVVIGEQKVKFPDDWHNYVRYPAKGNEICFENGQSENRVEYYFDKRKGY